MEYKAGDKFVLELTEVNGNGVRFNNGFYCVGNLFLDELEVLDGDYVNENFGELQEESHNAGMNEVWELAEKLFLNEKDGGIPDSDMDEIFGEGWSVEDILNNFTAQEALEKIAKHKCRKADKVSYGDVVRSEGVNGIILDNYNDNSWHVYTENGSVEVWSDFVKLGNRGATLENIRLALMKEGVPDDEDV